jgi:hypothetical protein
MDFHFKWGRSRTEEEILERLDFIIQLLSHTGERIMADLSGIDQGIEELTQVTQGAAMLLDNLSNQLEGAVDDPEAVQAIVDKIRSTKDELVAAVVRNTRAEEELPEGGGGGGSEPYPDQGLPGEQPYPDNTLPGDLPGGTSAR